MPSKHPALVIALTAGLASTAIGFFANAGVEAPRFDDPPARVATAVFAGGCVSCLEADFDEVYGVVETVTGFTGGTLENPTARDVAKGETGHYAAVKVTYNPSRVSYAELAEFFVRQIDPTDANGQFCEDEDSQRAAIFVAGQGERTSADLVLTKAGQLLGKDVVTPILPASTFWPADDSLQDYARRHVSRYEEARAACGRDDALQALWGTTGKNS